MIRRLTLADAEAHYAMRQRCMAEAYDFFPSSVADIKADGCKLQYQSLHKF
jgi:hypothetical protein